MKGHKTQADIDYEIHRYSDKPPNNDWVVKLVLILLVGAVFAWMCSCKTEKLDDKRLEKIHARHEVLTAKKLAKWYPPKIGSSHTDTLKNDSIKLYKNQAAALRLQLKNQKPIIKYHIDTVNNIIDTCVTIEDSQGSYDAGYNLGYKIGLYDGKGSCPLSTHTITDSIPSTILVQIQSLKNDTSINHDTIIKLTTQLQDSNDNAAKWRQRFWWLLIIAAIYTGIKVFKFFKPAPIKL